MDDIKKVKELEKLGDKLVEEKREELDSLCAYLKKMIESEPAEV